MKVFQVATAKAKLSGRQIQLIFGSWHLQYVGTRAIELGFDIDRLSYLGEVPAGPGLRRVREGSHQVSPPGRRKS
jgi:hypothetical protein